MTKEQSPAPDWVHPTTEIIGKILARVSEGDIEVQRKQILSYAALDVDAKGLKGLGIKNWLLGDEAQHVNT